MAEEKTAIVLPEKKMGFGLSKTLIHVAVLGTGAIFYMTW